MGIAHSVTGSGTPRVIPDVAAGAEALAAPSGPHGTSHQGLTSLSSPTITGSDLPHVPHYHQQEPQLRNVEPEDAHTRQSELFRCAIIVCLAGLIFYLLFIAIFICWVVMACFSFLSMNQSCDVPLKLHFWLTTVLLLWTVLLVRHVDNPAGRRNVTPLSDVHRTVYAAFAIFTLGLGIQCVFIRNGGTCRQTAPGFFHSSKAFVSLHIAFRLAGIISSLVIWKILVPWADSITGSPTPDTHFPPAFLDIGFGGLRSLANPRTGAPSGCIERMQVVALKEFPESYARECCICMGEFAVVDAIVATSCHHVFHKSCCQYWLSRSRTCPMCRADIPSSLNMDDEETAHGAAQSLNIQRTMSSQDLQRIVWAHRRQEEEGSLVANTNGLPPNMEFVQVSGGNLHGRVGLLVNLSPANAPAPISTTRSHSAIHPGSNGLGRSNRNSGTRPLSEGNPENHLNSLSQQEPSNATGFSRLLRPFQNERPRPEEPSLALLPQDHLSGEVLPPSNGVAVGVGTSTIQNGQPAASFRASASELTDGSNTRTVGISNFSNGSVQPSTILAHPPWPHRPSERRPAANDIPSVSDSHQGTMGQLRPQVSLRLSTSAIHGSVPESNTDNVGSAGACGGSESAPHMNRLPALN